jgi:hypothetical protein
MLHIQLRKVTGIPSSVTSKCKGGVVFRVTLNPVGTSQATRAVKDSKPDFKKHVLSLPLQGLDRAELWISAQLVGSGKSGEIAIGTSEFPLAICPERRYVRDSFTFTGKGHHAAEATGQLSIHVASDGAPAFSCGKAALDVQALEAWRGERDSRHRKASKRSKSSDGDPRRQAPPPGQAGGPLNPIESIPVCVLESVEAAFATAPDEALAFFSDFQFLKGGLEYFRVTGLEEHFRA